MGDWGSGMGSGSISSVSYFEMCVGCRGWFVRCRGRSDFCVCVRVWRLVKEGKGRKEGNKVTEGRKEGR